MVVFVNVRILFLSVFVQNKDNHVFFTKKEP